MPKPLRKWPLIPPFGLYRVVGESMEPTYQPGDTLLGWRWIKPNRLGLGAVVVAHLDDGRPVIKRLQGRLPGGQLDLRGDNAAASTDSRHFGPIDPSRLVARVIIRLP